RQLEHDVSRLHAGGVAPPPREVAAVAVEPVSPFLPRGGGGAPLRLLLIGELVCCWHDAIVADAWPAPRSRRRAAGNPAGCRQTVNLLATTPRSMCCSSTAIPGRHRKEHAMLRTV